MNLTVLSKNRDDIRFLYVNLAATVFQPNSIETEGATQYTRMLRSFKHRTRWIWMRWRGACEVFIECKRLMIVSKNGHPRRRHGALHHLNVYCWWQQQSSVKCKQIWIFVSSEFQFICIRIFVNRRLNTARIFFALAQHGHLHELNGNLHWIRLIWRSLKAHFPRATIAIVNGRFHTKWIQNESLTITIVAIGKRDWNEEWIDLHCVLECIL